MPTMQMQVVYMPKVYVLQAAHYTWLLIKLMPKGVIPSFFYNLQGESLSVQE